MKKVFKRNFFVLLLLVIPFFLFFASSFFKTKQATNITPRVTPPIAKATQRPDPIIASWKTFRNSTYGLLFKCPYSWRGNDDIVVVNTFAVLFTNYVNGETYLLGIRKQKTDNSLKQIGSYLAGNDVTWNIYEDASLNISYMTFKNGYEYFFSFPNSQTNHQELETVLGTVTIHMKSI